MTRSEALSRGFCARCAPYTPPSGDIPGRKWCALGRRYDQCGIDPSYREWLVRNKLVKGDPDPRVDLGVFEGVKPAGKKARAAC